MEPKFKYPLYTLVIILCIVIVYGILYIRDVQNPTIPKTPVLTRPPVESLVIDSTIYNIPDSLDFPEDDEEVPDSLYTKKFNSSGSATVTLKKHSTKSTIKSTSVSLP